MSKDLTVPSAEEIERGEKAVQAIMERVQMKVARTVEGLFLNPGEPGYNDDAPKPYMECSVKTRAALQLAKSAMEKQGSGEGRVLGLVMLAGRIPSKAAWEAEARRVDEEERRKVVDVKEGK